MAQYGRDIGAIRRRLDGRGRFVSIGLVLLLALAAIAAMSLGDYVLSPEQIVRSLLSPWTGEKTPGADFIVLNVRLPRMVLALLAGAAFGLSGGIFQTLLRNPLASPDIIGISSGASAAAVFCIVILGWSGALLSVGALVGAMLTALAMYLLAWRGGVSVYRVVLIGIAAAAMLSAVISYLFTRARIVEVQHAMGWLIGSLNAAHMGKVVPLALMLALLAPAAAFLNRALSILPLGDDTAIALGLPVEKTRLALLGVGVALSAFATAATGPVAFVAFVSGPIARRLIGTGRVGLFPTMLVGAIVMLASDSVAQHAIPATQLPVGVVTGIVGAIFLLWLLASANRAGAAA